MLFFRSHSIVVCLISSSLLFLFSSPSSFTLKRRLMNRFVAHFLTFTFDWLISSFVTRWYLSVILFRSADETQMKKRDTSSVHDRQIYSFAHSFCRLFCSDRSRTRERGRERSHRKRRWTAPLLQIERNPICVCMFSCLTSIWFGRPSIHPSPFLNPPSLRPIDLIFFFVFRAMMWIFLPAWTFCLFSLEMCVHPLNWTFVCVIFVVSY